MSIVDSTYWLYTCVQCCLAGCWKHGQASSWFDYVSKAARDCHWTTVWEVWWQVCDLWLLRASLYTCPRLWRMQLWVVSGSMCHIRRSRNIWCLLL